jgi:peptide/nickel transport system substrate-binding protein
VAVDRDPVSLDPHIEASYRTQWAVGGAYNRPLSLSSDLKIDNELVESWEQPDDTTLVLKIRSDVKFHNLAPVNGRAMTAEDVIWSIDRIRTDAPEFQRRYMFESISSMTATDPNTVEMKLAAPFAPIFAYLANPFTVVAPREVVDANGDLRTVAIGTGPFILDDLQKGVSYTSIRNPDYWEPNRPYLDSYNLLVVPDGASRFSSFRAGQLDIEEVSAEDAAQISGDNSMKVGESTQGGQFSLRFNCTKPPFSDVRVRKAFDLIIDRQQIIDLTLGGAGVPQGPIAAGLSDWAIPQDDLLTRPGYRADKDADIAEAKALLEQAGATDTEFEFIYYTPAAIHEQVAVVVQQQLQAAGVNVKLTKHEYAAWIPLMLEKNYQITGTASGFRDNPDEYLYALFHSQASRNDTGFSDLDALMVQQRTTLDEEARKALVLDIQDQLLEHVPNSWIYTETALEARYNYVSNYELTYAHNRMRQFAHTWLDQ